MALLREAAARNPADPGAQHEPGGEPHDEALRGGRPGAGRKDADVEILERHHRFKEDAPSGTALKFGEIISRRDGPERPAARPPGPARASGRTNEIGYHAIRVGDNPGEHTIVFAMLGETIELTVGASSRDCYAAGALAAAKFLAGKPPDCTT